MPNDCVHAAARSLGAVCRLLAVTHYLEFSPSEQKAGIVLCT